MLFSKFQISQTHTGRRGVTRISGSGEAGSRAGCGSKMGQTGPKWPKIAKITLYLSYFRLYYLF